MSLVDVLKRSRAFVASGWSEPFCRDAKGRISSPDAEDVERYAVLDVIAHCAGGERANIWRAWEALESVVTPNRAARDAFDRAHPPAIATDDDLRRYLELNRAALNEVDLQDWLEAKGRHQGAVLRAFDIAILRAAAIERAERTRT